MLINKVAANKNGEVNIWDFWTKSLPKLGRAQKAGANANGQPANIRGLSGAHRFFPGPSAVQNLRTAGKPIIAAQKAMTTLPTARYCANTATRELKHLERIKTILWQGHILEKTGTATMPTVERTCIGQLAERNWAEQSTKDTASTTGMKTSRTTARAI